MSVTHETLKQRFELPKKSLKELRARFCEHWRRTVSDDEFLNFIRDVTADSEHLKHNHKRNALRPFFLLNVGDEYYDISVDRTFRLTE